MPVSSGSPQPTHILAFAYEFWGHTRPLCNFLSRLVKTRKIRVTFLTTQGLFDRVQLELARNFDASEEHLRELLRVIAIVHKGATPLDVDVYHASFKEAYLKLVNEDTMICAQTGLVHDPVPSPSTAILDFFGLEPLGVVRKFSRRKVKVFIWHSCTASTLLPLFGALSQGGPELLRPKIEEEADRTGRSFDEIGAEIAFTMTGAVVKAPGLPPMYDYEFHAQKRLAITPGTGKMWASAHDAFVECDGVIMQSIESFEPDAIAGVKAWFALTSRPAFACGPLHPIGEQAIENEKKQSDDAEQIIQFLDTVLKSHGERSVLYISFSTFFLAAEPEKIWALLDVVMDLKIPFIMSRGSPRVVIPEFVATKVADYGLGILSPWSPQQTILAHPATAWFVTHCGLNSVMESISSGVPMICWPFYADQPANAVHISYGLNVGYELMEVRSGHGLKPLYRTGKAPSGTIEAVKDEVKDVLTKAFGSDGQEKRANSLKLQSEVMKAWAEDGPSARAFSAFLDSL